MAFQHGRKARLLLVGMFGLVLAACHPTPSDPPTPLDASQARADLPDTARAQLTSETSAPVSAQSFMVQLQALPANEQTRVSDWYRRIGGPPMDDATPAQFAWMRARNYPMPEDIARAAAMSDAELKAAAGAGNTIAKMLYCARLLDQFHAREAAGAPFGDPILMRLLSEISLLMPEILGSGSPYAGYLYAAKSRLMHPRNDEGNAADLLAGLVWAGKFGDTRAYRSLNVPNMQAVDAGTAGSAMASMLMTAIFANPHLFSTPAIPMPEASP